MKTQNTQRLALEIQNKKSKFNNSFDAGLRTLGIHQGLIKIKTSAKTDQGIGADCEKVNG